MAHAIEGVHAAAATPLDPDGAPDAAAFARHGLRLMAAGCHGIAALGTTGEATSFGLAERMALIDGALAAGLPASALIVGAGAPSVADAATLAGHATRAGAKGVLMLPPYYYKAVSDEGLFRYYAELVEAVGSTDLRLVLYHIPPVSQVALSHELIERLLAAFPGIVCAIKDSGGDLDNMTAMNARFPGLAVLSGADPLMRPLLAAGGAGCITAAANLCAAPLRVVWDGRSDDAAEEAVAEAQSRIEAWRALCGRHAPIPAIKAMLAHRHGETVWERLKPPLVELPEAQRRDVLQGMAALGG